VKSRLNTVRHIAKSRSQDEFFSKVMTDVENTLPEIDTDRKAKALIEEIVFNAKVGHILNYSQYEIRKKEANK